MENSNLEKFAFVGVLLLATLFSSNYSRGDIKGGEVLLASLTPIPQGIVRGPDGVSVADPAPQPGFQATQVSRDVGFKPPDFYRVAEVDPTSPRAAAALVAHVGGEDYYELNALRRWPIASIAKLMTAVVALKFFDPDEIIAFEERDLQTVRSQDSFINIGDRYTVRDVLRMMLLQSWNEAAEALTKRFGRLQFIAAMNDQARAWGLGATYFSDPTGLAVSNQSTARDLKELAAHIYNEYPEVFLIGRQRSSTVTEQSSGLRSAITNINAFAGDPAFLGGKTGFTDESNGNLLSLFEYGGRPVAVVVLGADDRFEETQSLINWFRHAFRSSN